MNGSSLSTRFSTVCLLCCLSAIPAFGWNEPPVADIDNSVTPYLQSVALDAKVILDGSDSYDPDYDDIITYRWRIDQWNGYAYMWLRTITDDEPSTSTSFSQLGKYRITLDVEDEHHGWSEWPDSCYVYLVDVSISGDDYIALGAVVAISASVDPWDIGGEARLSKSCSGTGDVNVWRPVGGNPKGQLLSLPWSWPMSHGTIPPLNVEATGTSSAIGDVTLTLSYIASGQVIESDSETFTIGLKMRLEKVGNTQIDSTHSYSENTTIRVTALFANGTPCVGFTGTVNIAEYQTNLYAQHTDKGACLPTNVSVTSGGTATFVARSLADPINYGPNQSGDPPPPAKLRCVNFPTESPGYLNVPQWTDDLGRVHGEYFCTPPAYDWFETRTLNMFSTTNPDIVGVLWWVDGYDLQGAADEKGRSWTVCGQEFSSISFNPHWVETRLDIPDDDYYHTCGEAMGPDHTQTVLHEGRHCYQAYLTSGWATLYGGLGYDDDPAVNYDNDEDQDWLVDEVPIEPSNFLIDSDAEREKCVGTVSFQDDTRYDNYQKDQVGDWDNVLERDAEGFAARFY